MSKENYINYLDIMCVLYETRYIDVIEALKAKGIQHNHTIVTYWRNSGLPLAKAKDIAKTMGWEDPELRPDLNACNVPKNLSLKKIQTDWLFQNTVLKDLSGAELGRKLEELGLSATRQTIHVYKQRGFNPDAMKALLEMYNITLPPPETLVLNYLKTSSSANSTVTMKHNTLSYMDKSAGLTHDTPTFIKTLEVDATLFNPNITHHLHQINDDTMFPTYKDKDTLVVTPVHAIEDNGVYLISIADQNYVRRIQVIPTQGLQIISDNTKYPPFTLPTDQVKPLAKVLGSWTFIPNM